MHANCLLSMCKNCRVERVSLRRPDVPHKGQLGHEPSVSKQVHGYVTATERSNRQNIDCQKLRLSWLVKWALIREPAYLPRASIVSTAAGGLC
jgi:hypothetical protein